MSKNYYSDREQKYLKFIKENNIDAADSEAIKWLYSHCPNKFIEKIEALISNNDRPHNERNAGRKSKELPVTSEMIRMRQGAGETLEQIAKSYDMSRSTLYKILKSGE